MSNKRGVLFVCLGNICRSPIAEAVFTHIIKERGLTDKWYCDSAGTGQWHIGHEPDHRAVRVLTRHNVEVNHRARQITKEDFNTFEYIFGMDNANINDIKRIAPRNCRAKIELLGEYDRQNDTIIRDPYYDSGDSGFETNFQQCLRSCNAFLDKLSL